MKFFTSLPFVIFVLAAIVVGVVWWVNSPSQNDPTKLYNLNYEDSKTVALGKGIYVKHCAACHGVALEGQKHWRSPLPNGRLRAPPHDATGHTWHHPDQQLFNLTKLGPAAMAGGGHQSDMPGYQNILSDEEILAVLAFIKSTWPVEIQQRHDQINLRAALQRR